MPYKWHKLSPINRMREKHKVESMKLKYGEDLKQFINNRSRPAMQTLGNNSKQIRSSFKESSLGNP